MSSLISPPAPPVDDSRQAARILTPLLLGPVIYVFMQAMVIPSITRVSASLHVSPLDGTWVLTAYLLSGAVSTPLAGRLGDLFGNRRILVWVLWITVAGGVLSAVSNSFVPVVLGRVLAGTSTATMPLGYGVMRESLAVGRLPKAVALVAVSIAVGTAAGNMLAGTVLDQLGTHWLFWLPLFITVPTCVMAQLWIPESPARVRRSVHWAGAAAMAVALLALLIAISESTLWGWGSARTLGLLAFGFAATAVWVLVELRAAQPLIDMRLMALPAVWRTNLTSLLFGFGMFGAFAVVPQFVETPSTAGYGFGASITAAGLFLLPGTITMSFGGPIAGRLEHRFGPKRPLIVGGVLTTVGFVLIAVLHADPWSIYVAFVLLGVGMGVGYAVLPHLIVQAVPHEHTGAATGINVIARNIGGAIGIQVGATVIAASAASGSQLPTAGGYIGAFWLLAGLGGVGALLGAATIPTRRTATPSPSIEPAARIA
jgi:MFS family permease